MSKRANTPKTSGKTSKKTSLTAAKPSIWRRLNPFRWVLRHWLKLLLVSGLLIGGYGLYLDAQIKKKFAGNN
jgi:penicillin-binding protein 1B